MVAVIGLLLVVALAFRADSSVVGVSEDPDGDDAGRQGGPPADRPADPLEALSAELAACRTMGRCSAWGHERTWPARPRWAQSRAASYVELQLFAETRSGRCETEPLDGGAPFSVAAGRLEEDVRAIVVPKRLPTLARALRNAGRDTQPGELEGLPFMLELSPDLEGELVRRTATAPGAQPRGRSPGTRQETARRSGAGPDAG